MGNRRWLHIFTATCLGSAAAFAMEEAEVPPIELVVSVAEQKLALVKDGAVVRKYPISTSKFGLGDSYGSYKTPLGRLRVCEKIGASLPLGSVLKSRNATGEILPANAPGRDPIVTRILWLDGLESCNAGAKGRGIYIHGTVEESKLGQPVSYGCIRMRSRDVVELFDDTPMGATVQIISEKFPRFHKAAKPEILFASNTKAKPIAAAPATNPAKPVRPGEVLEKAKPVATAAPQLAAAKTARAPEATGAVARVTPPEPPAMDGPVIVFSTPKVVPPPQPRVMFIAFNSAAPTPPREPLLQIAEPFDLLAFSAGRAMPLDQLSAHLLEAPAPPLRLAFRAPTIGSRVPDL